MSCLACVSQLGEAGPAGEVSAAFTENVKPKRILKNNLRIEFPWIDRRILLSESLGQAVLVSNKQVVPPKRVEKKLF
jgi:hypothetical protein